MTEHDRNNRPPTGDAAFMAAEYPLGTVIVRKYADMSIRAWRRATGVVTPCPSGRNAGQHAVMHQVYLVGAGDSEYFLRYGTGDPALEGKRGLWATLAPLHDSYVVEVRKPPEEG
jgi:hypothetical protein